MDVAAELTLRLCGISAISAIAEVLLSGRRGADIVCMMLGFAGAAEILNRLVEFL